MDDKYFMKEALKEAEIAFAKDEVPIGAVIVKDDEIIARAHNLKELRQNPLAHAELLAIEKASNKLGTWRLQNCSIFVTLEPCPMCAGAIVQARMKRVIFAASDLKSGACGSLYNLAQDERLNHSLEVKSGILANKSSKLLKDFFQKLRDRN